MKEKFIKSTIILLIGGLLTKILGMIIKITLARLIGPKGIGLYMLILPTFMLLINISQFGLPTALSKLVAEDKRNNKKLYYSILPITIIINIMIIILIIIIAPLISTKLLHNKDLNISIISMALVIPFTSISSICRSYFFGKQKMLPHVISNIIEDFIRLIIYIIGIPFIKPLGLKYIVCFLVLSNVISEFSSTIVLLFFIPKNITIKKEDLKIEKQYLKDSLHISIPTTTNRFIASIGYFLEPITLTTFLLKNNYTLTYITKEYGIISGYILPLLLLPSFFTGAISQSLLPQISKDYTNNNIKRVKKVLKTGIFLSLLIAIPITTILYLYPKLFLKLLYHTNLGIKYLKFLAPICLLEYLQSPLNATLDALGKSKDNLKGTIIGTISRLLFLIILSYLKIGIWSYIISLSINIILVTIYELIKVKKYLK